MLFYVREEGLAPVNSSDDIINHKDVLKKDAKAKAIEKLDEIIETTDSISSTLNDLESSFLQ